ncbi:hypothetical protein WJX73_001438 [Symbiochloris irregularis]|uniref:protein-tyrosine-phosphatase n=1 Tax=Symbiochloris irregularis TaxID=706552 RepID=A0AAW1NPY3_9CHLO
MATAGHVVALQDSEAFRDTDANSVTCLRTSASFYVEYSSRQKLALSKVVAARRHIEVDKEPCRVLQGLYIGSLGAARSRATLKRLGISHIVNASPVVPCFHRHSFKYKTVLVYDDNDEDIMQHFHETNKFINEARQAGGALVHCYAGKSRSATLILAYLLACEGLPLHDAFAVLLAARPCAAPNSGFMQQLAQFSSAVHAA